MVCPDSKIFFSGFVLNTNRLQELIETAIREKAEWERTNDRASGWPRQGHSRLAHPVLSTSGHL